jgi:hypothetical protein
MVYKLESNLGNDKPPYHIINKERLKIYFKQYYNDNKEILKIKRSEKIQQRKEYNKEYYRRKKNEKYQHLKSNNKSTITKTLYVCFD